MTQVVKLPHTSRQWCPFCPKRSRPPFDHTNWALIFSSLSHSFKNTKLTLNLFRSNYFKKEPGHHSWFLSLCTPRIQVRRTPLQSVIGKRVEVDKLKYVDFLSNCFNCRGHQLFTPTKPLFSLHCLINL